MTDKAKKQEYDSLIKEIRCVTCPNQSIADSQTPIAHSMKEEIFRRIENGESKQDIREYLLSHYGEYITYRPPVQKETWGLWCGPLVMLIIGISVWGRFFYKGQKTP